MDGPKHSAISSRTDWRPTPTPASWCTRPCGRSRAPSPTSSCRPVGWPPVCANAASGRATWSRSSCRTGWRPRRRSGRRRSSVRWWCRSCTSTAARNSSHIIDNRPAEGVHHRRGVRADEIPARPVRGRADRRAGREHDFDDLLADEPLAGTIAADPASPALIAFTSGTTSDPKGVDPQPSDARLRDPPAARRTTRPTAAGS